MDEYRTGFAQWGSGAAGAARSEIAANASNGAAPAGAEPGAIDPAALSGALRDFGQWSLSGTALEPALGAAPGGGRGGPAIRLDPARAERGTDPFPRGGYEGGDYYNGGSFLVGEATGPELETGFGCREAVASWNADAPAGSWVEARLRARQGGAWTPWYVMGIWAAGDSPVRRHSVAGQSDERASVQTDKLVLRSPAEALQQRVLLFSADGSALPSLRLASLAWSTSPAGRGASPEPSAPVLPPALVELVPAYSQMVYPDGGNVWCSPTCVSMILAHRGLAPEGEEARVRKTVAAVYDRVYDGHGNWSFNVAYAGSLGFDARVMRFSSLAGLEPWIAAGVPVALSLGWDEGAGRPLPGAPIPKSRGHLTRLVGFDGRGDAVMNEPASKDPAGVRRTYPRAFLEARWLESSGGTAYLISPGV